MSWVFGRLISGCLIGLSAVGHQSSKTIRSKSNPQNNDLMAGNEGPRVYFSHYKSSGLAVGNYNKNSTLQFLAIYLIH